MHCSIFIKKISPTCDFAVIQYIEVSWQNSFPAGPEQYPSEQVYGQYFIM